MSGLPRSPATVENLASIRVRGARLEHRGLGVGADVAGDLEPAERAAALGVRLPLLDPLPVEVGHLLDQVAVLQQDRPARADGQRIRVALDRDAGCPSSGPDWVACWSYLYLLEDSEKCAGKRLEFSRAAGLA